MPNRLAGAASPYLLQHADNPVDWHEWGPEALRRAAELDRPLLLSIGYAACHWCHVMAHETFEDPRVGAFLADRFVCVKVDREERPDVDAVYMAAVQAMTGSGGWPLTVVATPDGVPFFGGTYFPPADRPGMPSFLRVMAAMDEAWRGRRDEVEATARSMREHLVAGGAAPPAVAAPRAEAASVDAGREEAVRALLAGYDERGGGFGGAPKFPPHGALRFLLRGSGPRELAVAGRILEAMADGGIFDQLGGGFHRYSVDGAWRVPHFEKMLYDNAQLLQRYAEAFARTGRERFREVVRRTVAFAARELRLEDGGWASALDADSAGAEGRFYVWVAAEVDALAGRDAALVRAVYGVRTVGELEGRNVLRRASAPADAARELGEEPEGAEARVEAVARRLREVRAERERPALDDKALASWNGMMLAGLSDAARLCGDGAALELARATATFLRERSWRDGRLFHVWRRGELRVEGLLEDYVHVGLGLLALHRVTLEGDWLAWALTLGESLLARFEDEGGGGFFAVARDAPDADTLPVRPRAYLDAAVPADNAAAAELLARLARVTGRSDLRAAAERALAAVGDAPARYPQAFASTLVAREVLAAPPRELVLVGEAGAPDSEALRRVWLRHADEDTAVLRVRGPDDPLAAASELARGRDRLGGAATAYLCEGGVCGLPTTAPEVLERQLREAGRTPLPV